MLASLGFARADGGDAGTAKKEEGATTLAWPLHARVALRCGIAAGAAGRFAECERRSPRAGAAARRVMRCCCGHGRCLLRRRSTRRHGGATVRCA